jgi:glucosylceramidase
MPRCALIFAFLALITVAATGSAAQSVSVYETSPDLVEALSPRTALHFTTRDATATTPLISVDDTHSFQQIDGFGASLTDAAAWLFTSKLTPAQTDLAFKMLFSRKNGIALGFLRQPLGSSDLSVTFYSFDDLCRQTTEACTTPASVDDFGLQRFTIQHDEAYILPLLKKALELNPDLHVMLTPWSPPGWMKDSGSMLGVNPATQKPSMLRPEAATAYALYLVKTIKAYQADGVPVYALSVQNEPLYAPANYSGMLMPAEAQADFLANALAPMMANAEVQTNVLIYDHNWDRPDYPETVLKNDKARELAAGIAWHHYAGDPAAMSKLHEEFPQKGEWVTEASGGTWQKGNILTAEGAELVASMRNWARSYVLWALATDQNHGPHVGGCDNCRGVVTIDELDATHATVKPEVDYYVLGQASKFVQPGAVRIASNEPAETAVKDVAFHNPDGTIVLYTVNTGSTAQQVRIGYRQKTAATTLKAGAVATFIWKP